MHRGIVSVKVAAAAVSMLLAGCGGSVAGHEDAPAQVRQDMRWDPASPGVRPKLSTGRFHNLALKSDGSVWAWGHNVHKQLADGTTINRYQPVPVQGLTGTFVAVATGHYHSMAIRDDGTLWAWGNNGAGQLGNVSSGAPVQVRNLTNVVAMGGGESFSMALDADGKVWAWGNNYYCQLGNNSYSPSGVPGQVMTVDPTLPYLTGVVAIAAGHRSGLAIRNDGTLWAWGNNANGRLGDGTTAERCKAVKISLPISDPTPEDPSDNVVPVDIAMGDNHTLLLLSDGTVMAWGNNGHGQLGTGGSAAVPSPASSLTPIQVPGLSNVTQIDAGAFTSLAVTSGGVFYAWGYHGYGQLCLGTGGGYSNSRAVVPTTSLFQPAGLEYVGAGEYFSVAMASNGTLWSCGFEGYGALGYEIPGTASYNNTMLQVPGFP